MTDVLLVCGKDGSFKALCANGHSGFAVKGKDICCAGISNILRTALEFLENTKGVVLKKQSSIPGILAFCVEETPGQEVLDRLKSTAEIIRIGIKNLESEFPENVQLREKTEE